MPKSNRKYWNAKLSGNVQRDRRNRRKLRRLGWGVLTIWECQLRDMEKVEQRIIDFLER